MTIREKIRNWKDKDSNPKIFFKFLNLRMSVWKQCGQILPQTSIWTNNFYFSVGYVFHNGLGLKCFYKSLFNFEFCWHGKISWDMQRGKIIFSVLNYNILEW